METALILTLNSRQKKSTNNDKGGAFDKNVNSSGDSNSCRSNSCRSSSSCGGSSSSSSGSGVVVG